MGNDKAKVMVVDDDQQIQNLLKMIVEKSGYPCVTCSSGKEALSALLLQKVDLVFLDICMPEMSGVEVLEKIKGMSPSTKVIMITGLEDMEAARKCMDMGASDFITKPFDMTYLETSMMTELLPLG